MSRSVLYMSMSLDGFITGPDDDASQGLGRGGERLHAWLGEGEDPSTFHPTGLSGGVFDEIMATGAVLTGRRTFDHAGQWGGDHHDGVPIFVPTRGEPGEPAADRVHGASTAQSCLQAGVLDDLEIQLIPVLLGAGRPLFGTLGNPVGLELTRVIDAPGVTHLRYRVESTGFKSTGIKATGFKSTVD